MLRGFLATALLATGLYAQSSATLEPRVVLALSTSPQNDRSNGRFDPCHDLLQMPLNYLGITTRHCNTTSRTPPTIEWDLLRGVVVWHDGQAKTRPWLWNLLNEARRRGKRVVHFGDFSAFASPAADEHLARLGLGRPPTRDRADSSYVKLDEAVLVEVGSTNPWYESLPVYSRLHTGPVNRSRTNQTRVWTRHRQSPEQRTPVLTGDWGGIAFQPWALHLGRGDGDRRWYIDPFEFLATALDLKSVPAPDPSVVCGKRAFFFHVDGDGFESLSTARPGKFCGEVFDEEVVQRFKLPMTLSVIVAGITNEFAPATPTKRMRIAARMLAQPFVEAASHAVLHPLNWRRRVTRRTPKRTVNWYDDLPGYDHNMVAEVTDSIGFINSHLLPKGKRCRVMLWSGLANPSQAAILAARQAGCLNLNGGVYRWDQRRNSVGYVAPWGKQVGNAWQVYCGAPNENVYEGFFDTMPGAFELVNETLVNTGGDRILKPANIYAHFYSVERPARLRALLRLLQRWGIDEDTAPIFASRYAAAVRDAHSTFELLRHADGWLVRGAGVCRTVRIEDESRHIDWVRSTGVLGAVRRDRRLFVHLAGPTANITFTANAMSAPHLRSANHAVEGSRQADGMRLRSKSHAPRILHLAGFRPKSALTMRIDGASQSRSATEHGELLVQLPPGDTVIEVRQR